VAITLKHATLASTPDDGTSEVGTDEWNADHSLQMATNKLLGRTTASTGAVEEVDMVGMQVGYARTASSTTASTNTTIPNDATIPQSTEGAAYTSIDVAYTPKFASSLLEIEVSVPIVSANTISGATLALFESGVANAIIAKSIIIGASDYFGDLSVRVVVAASSTSARTYTLRFGNTSGTATIYLLRTPTAAVYGAASIATMTVKEIKQ
jgi:hypothetical protein